MSKVRRMRALVFASRDQPETFDSAERLVGILNMRKAVPARLIDKLTSKVEELLLIAEYGVVESTVVILLDDTGLRARLRPGSLPGPDSLELAVEQICRQ